jgi:hypothetical protein
MNKQNPLTKCDWNESIVGAVTPQDDRYDKTNISQNPTLLSIVQSLSKTSELYFSRSTPLQWNPNVNDHLQAVSNSSSTTSHTCNDSLLTWPSSVHIADVTYGPCVTYEHTPSHGVSETANETNVNCGIILGDAEGMMSCSALCSNGLARKRSAVMTNDSMPAYYTSKRFNQECNDKSLFCCSITFAAGLKEYLEETNDVPKPLMDHHQKKKQDVAHSEKKCHFIMLMIQCCNMANSNTYHIQMSFSLVWV